MVIFVLAAAIPTIPRTGAIVILSIADVIALKMLDLAFSGVFRTFRLMPAVKTFAQFMTLCAVLEAARVVDVTTVAAVPIATSVVVLCIAISVFFPIGFLACTNDGLSGTFVDFSHISAVFALAQFAVGVLLGKGRGAAAVTAVPRTPRIVVTVVTMSILDVIHFPARPLQWFVLHARVD